MTILGLVAMPKAGKGVVVEALKAEGWTHISMSGVLLQHMKEDRLPWLYELGEDPEKPSRASYFKSSSYYRRQHHPGILSMWCMEEIEKLPEDKRKKVVIDGLRHPAEMEHLLRACPDAHFWGIKTHEDESIDREIRLTRLKNQPDQRGKNFESNKLFHWIEYLENARMPTYDTSIGECFTLLERYRSQGIGDLLINSGITEEDKVFWQDEIRRQAKKLETVSYGVERAC